MKKFLFKLFLICLPFLIVTAIYFIDDPFMVLRRYDRYDKTDIAQNENLIGWDMLQQEKDSIHFNSFLMGNSCTQGFRCRNWETHLAPGDRAFRWFDNNESITGIRMKLQALEEDGDEVKNILIILDYNSFTKPGQRPGAIHLMPREVTGQSYLAYHADFLQLFAYPDFFFPYIWHKIDKSYTKVGIVNDAPSVRDSITNDALNYHDAQIAKEGESYWTRRPLEFPKRHAVQTAPPTINQECIVQLDSIKAICTRRGTKAILVIGPDYMEKRLNPKDLAILKQYFGPDNVYDFSGSTEYSRDMHNYYNKGHFRPQVGNDILRRIYASDSPTDTLTHR